jgi:hypothetical protein
MSGRKTFVGGDILLASELNGFLMDQAVMVFDDAAARTTAIPSPAEGMVTFLKSSDTLEAWNGSAFVNVASVGTSAFRFVTTVYFTSSGTFSKADYPWLRAIRVKCQGGGASGSVRSFNDNSGSGGPGGGYAESFITNISSLDASVTVTRGAGGAAITRSSIGETVGNAGTNSSFGALVVGNGGPAGTTLTSPTGGSGTGDLVLPGGGAGPGASGNAPAGHGGGSHLGNGGTGGYLANSNQNGTAGSLYGGGGGGARVNSEGSTASSGAGADGIVIVELYA